MRNAGWEQPRGMYDPQYEHDACGVGAVASLRGVKSHKIILDALEILKNLEHRGACGCDAATGDGAGILIQIPDRFLRKAAGAEGIRLPAEREYAAGNVFLPTDEAERGRIMQWFEDVVRAEGQDFLGWRRVPTHNDTIGELARRAEPAIYQIFIGRGKGLSDQSAFERKLYVIRKVMERTVRESSLSQRASFHVPSLSSRTLNYKGLLLAPQIPAYYSDLADEDMVSGLALVHQRYSTNTFPSWDLAQPFRFLCHNGEINTLRGNINWMTARQGLFQSELFGEDIGKLFPIATPGASDSAILDNALELLYHTGRSLPHAMMMLIPEAWQNHRTMSKTKRAFYEYHSCLMEPWDGPASIPFSDGIQLGAMLDRNGLRPSRYLVTKDGYVVMGSETGALEIDPANVERKGRLEPGRMFLVDMEQGRVINDEEIKDEICSRRPYIVWLGENLVAMDELNWPLNGGGNESGNGNGHAAGGENELLLQQQAFGYTLEDLRILMSPMAQQGAEAIGSMGNDSPLAVLSDKPHLLYNYFKQLFAQVTNPPLDGIREELVTSLVTNLGSEQDLFQETPLHCRQLRVDRPVLTEPEMDAIRRLNQPGLRSTTLPILYPVAEGGEGLRRALDELCGRASRAIDDGCSILILSDRGLNRDLAPIPALLAVAGVHHHLIREMKRTRCGIVLESGEPREVHHFCLLFGYGCGAVHPYLALRTVEDMVKQRILAGAEPKKAKKNYIKAVDKGVLKVMSKMGISTLQSYRGAQIFEAVGLSQEVVDAYFSWTASRLGGVGLDVIAEEARRRHERAFPRIAVPEKLDLEMGGQYQWRRDGEHHLFNPLTIAKLQEAARNEDPKTYAEYAELINNQNRQIGTLRGLLDFRIDPAREIPLEEVEPWTAIVKRFKTGAMSYGSISQEAHETLAIAMNRLGGRSNTGEGGEDRERFKPDANGDLRRSAIKQVASGRFGVTIEYLTNADELQIKMAQGAKPGEGGQLPGEKVYPWIAKTRHSTPWVGLISPPPHHDIYSIEDLAQLIHDLKNSNPRARINVKLVAEVGVGTVAAGVAKGKADVVLISGHDGGTGASPQTSIKHAGLPWELGVAETHQTLVENDLRSRIVVECDGQLKTGRDVAIACLLGAEEFGFSTAPLVTLGCIMMRKCHLNTCPVGVATQDPELRKKFEGKPEHVVNYLHFVAEELRRIMASLGYRTVNEMVGQSDRLRPRDSIEHWKACRLDFARILRKPDAGPNVGLYRSRTQDHGLENALDHELIRLAAPALEGGRRVEAEIRIRNTNRTVGTMLSHETIKRHENGLPDDTIVFHCKGSAGQSFCAFGVKGLTMHIQGDANDYFGKGLSGAKLTIRPPLESTFPAEKNILIGNVALYGATSGEAYVRGVAGERFCVRNSGARAVVEGVGDHGCEYMTGGRVAVLGRTGRNFAAGMSGGVAYVLDEQSDFWEARCNREMVDLEPVVDEEDIAELRAMIEDHLRYTESEVAERVLREWRTYLRRFIKVIPRDYKRALHMIARQAAEEEKNAAGERNERAPAMAGR